MITTKKHNQIIKKYQDKIKELESKIELKSLLEKMIEKISIITDKYDSIRFVDCNGELTLPDNVLQYVDDYFGGKVIKQEATKLVVLDVNGNATYHKTKKPVDKNRKYKLLQE